MLDSGPLVLGVPETLSAPLIEEAGLYDTAYDLATNAATRTPITIQAMHDRLAALKGAAKPVVAFVQASPTVTDSERTMFGVKIRDKSRTPGEITSPPPRHGAHTEEVLLGLGYSKEDVAALKGKGVV